MTTADDTGRKLVYPATPGKYVYSTKRILDIGDSITWGTTTVTPSCGYRDGLSNQLEAAGFSGIQWVGSVEGGDNCTVCPLNGLRMFNEGHPGFTCNELTTITPPIFAATKPDVVNAMIGTNDMIAVVEGTETIADAIAAWTEWFNTTIAQAPNAIFFIATLVPSFVSADMDAFNANIVSKVAAQAATGTLVYVVNQNGALTPVVDFDAGGVHPNTVGYAKMATKWFQSMTTLTP